MMGRDWFDRFVEDATGDADSAGGGCGCRYLVLLDGSEVSIILLLEAIELQMTRGYYCSEEIAVLRFILLSIMNIDDPPLPGGMFCRSPKVRNGSKVPWIVAMGDCWKEYQIAMTDAMMWIQDEDEEEDDDDERIGEGQRFGMAPRRLSFD